jgi:hypothetical protein
MNNLPRMDSNHDKAIQSRLCYRYTTRQKEGKFEYHIAAKSQMTMTEHRLRMIRQPPEQIPNDKLGGGRAVLFRSSAGTTARRAVWSSIVWRKPNA